MPIVAEKSVWFAPAMTGPISVIDAVPVAPNEAPVGAMLSLAALMLRPKKKGAVLPAPKPVVPELQSASYVVGPLVDAPTTEAGPTMRTTRVPSAARTPARKN
jgi:hypothetical protein